MKFTFINICTYPIVLGLLFLNCSSAIVTYSFPVANGNYLGNVKTFTPIPWENVSVTVEDSIAYFQAQTYMYKGNNKDDYIIRDTLFPIIDSAVIHYSQHFDDSTIDTSRFRVFAAEKVVFRGKYCEIYSSGKSLWCEYYTPISNSKNKIEIKPNKELKE